MNALAIRLLPLALLPLAIDAAARITLIERSAALAALDCSEPARSAR